MLIARYQVYFARVDGWISSEQARYDGNGALTVEFDREGALIDWATFLAIVEHLYGYARGSSDDAPKCLDASRVISTFFLHLDAASFDLEQEFRTRVENWVEHLTPGEVEKLGFNRCK